MGYHCHCRSKNEEDYNAQSMLECLGRPDLTSFSKPTIQNDIYAVLGMIFPTFRTLVSWLEENTQRRASRGASIELKVTVFLQIISKASKAHDTAEYFQRSTSTVSDFFHQVLESTTLLHREYVELSTENAPTPLKMQETKYKRMGGCLGALDGTHIPAIGPLQDQAPYRTRKGQLGYEHACGMRL